MGSGLATGATDDLHQFETTAGQLLDLLASQAVLGPPDTVYNYNNAAYCAGGYLPLLKQGVRAEDLTSTWRQTERQRVWQPAGMTDTLAADDARGLVDNYATGNGFDVTGAVRSLPFVGTGSSSPAGAALSTLRDMAGYVRLQLRSGVAVTGRRVVSAANLAECWKGHVDANPDRTVFPQDPDAVSSHYAMGWLSTTYRDGTRLVWHNGAIDGFTTYIGFLPGKDIGLVVLNAMNPNPVGICFYDYVRNLLLNRYGLNQGAAQVVQRQYDQAIADLRAAGSGARRVPTATANGLAGYYERGYRLEAERGNLVVHSGPRSYTVEQAKDGGYVIADGFLPGAPVTFGTDPDGTPRMVLAGAEDVRRTGLL
jgi:CubicO group peptidase (beta-lactamase class C family)